MKNARLLLSAVVPLLLLACGGGGGSSGPSKADRTVSTFDKLPVCSQSREGETAYVKDEDAVYVCESGAWTAGGSGGSSQKPGSSADQGSSGSGSNGGGNSSGPNSSSSQQGGEPEIPCADIWCGARGDTMFVLPELLEDTITAWAAGDDSLSGGGSTIEFAEGGIVASILAHGKISFSYSLAQGEMAAPPSVWLGFGVMPHGGSGADIYRWRGVCLTYSASAPFQVQVIPSHGIVTDYDYHAATVDSSTAVTSVDLPWSAFEQAGWGVAVDKNDVLASSKTIKLVFSGADGDSGETSLLEFGTPGSCGKSLE